MINNFSSSPNTNILLSYYVIYPQFPHPYKVPTLWQEDAHILMKGGARGGGGGKGDRAEPYGSVIMTRCVPCVYRSEHQRSHSSESALQGGFPHLPTLTPRLDLFNPLAPVLLLCIWLYYGLSSSNSLYDSHSLSVLNGFCVSKVQTTLIYNLNLHNAELNKF